MNREDGANPPQAFTVPGEFAVQQVERGMPVVQVHGIRQAVQRIDPPRSRGAEEGELVGVGGVRAQRAVVVVNAPRFGRHHRLVLEQHHADRFHDQLERAYGLQRAAEPDFERREFGSAGQAVECPVRRRQHCRAPPLSMQRSRQVAHDVADAADFAARQRAVFRSNKKNVSGGYDGVPRINA